MRPVNWRVRGGRGSGTDGRILVIIVPPTELGCDGEDDEDPYADKACQGVGHHPSDPPRAALDELLQETTHGRLLAQQRAVVSFFADIGSNPAEPHAACCRSSFLAFPHPHQHAFQLCWWGGGVRAGVFTCVHGRLATGL